uniref:DUF985 domain-containing protein n=1 Tax=Methanococcus maripaludis (strain C6 / ATCC BAA-1332) TaxID=444158 RepID=A9A662_METM6
MKTAEYFIKKLNLEKHPEGGFYKRIYQSEEVISKDKLPERYNSDRFYSTSIYYLLSGNDISKFHRLKSDEIWHYYFGSSAIIHIIDNLGNYNLKKLGPNLDKNENFQVIIPKNSYFAAEIIEKSSFIIVGCTVSPGFDFEDFELASKDELLKKYPEHVNLIKKFSD